MSTRYSLAHLTFLATPPPELVMLAARCGYDAVGLRLLEVTPGDAFPLLTDRAMKRETLARIADTGVGVMDVELARLTPNVLVEDFRPMMEAAVELGARHVLTQAHDADIARVTDRYGAFCDLAGEYGLTADVEYLPWTRTRTLADAVALVGAVGRPNAGVMIDTLHFHRAGDRPEAIAALPPGLFRFIQIADAPAPPPPCSDALIFAAREYRLAPGEGGLDLAAILLRLPADIPISIEIPNASLARVLTDDERASHLLAATRRLVASVEAERARAPDLRTV
jgi:sugar phosphate isomerase/epimerase